MEVTKSGPCPDALFVRCECGVPVIVCQHRLSETMNGMLTPYFQMINNVLERVNLTHCRSRNEQSTLVQNLPEAYHIVQLPRYQCERGVVLSPAGV